MGYEESDRVRIVHFFKESGKWYLSENVTFVQWEGQTVEAFEQALKLHLGGSPERLADTIAVCMEPWHVHAHPVMRRVVWMNGELKLFPVIV